MPCLVMTDNYSWTYSQVSFIEEKRNKNKILSWSVADNKGVCYLAAVVGLVVLAEYVGVLELELCHGTQLRQLLALRVQLPPAQPQCQDPRPAPANQERGQSQCEAGEQEAEGRSKIPAICMTSDNLGQFHWLPWQVEVSLQLQWQIPSSQPQQGEGEPPGPAAPALALLLLHGWRDAPGGQDAGHLRPSTKSPLLASVSLTSSLLQHS